MMSKNLNLIRNRGILFANICPSFLSFCLVWKDTNGGGGGEITSCFQVIGVVMYLLLKRYSIVEK